MKKISLYNRSERINLIYQVYLFSLISSDIKKMLHEGKTILNDRQINTILKTLEEKEFLEDKIIKIIPKTWKWNRINNLEKAILLNGAAEIILFSNDKKIVINESVEYSKKYCEEKAKNLINGILDNIK